MNKRIRATMQPRPKYYECGICGGIHPWEFDGDCRDARITLDDLEKLPRYELVSWREEAGQSRAPVIGAPGAS